MPYSGPYVLAWDGPRQLVVTSAAGRGGGGRRKHYPQRGGTTGAMEPSADSAGLNTDLKYVRRTPKDGRVPCGGETGWWGGEEGLLAGSSGKTLFFKKKQRLTQTPSSEIIDEGGTK